jgi:hypothetical protein
VTPRTRFLVLGLVGTAWLVLGLVNLAKGRAGIGAFYCLLGLGLVGLAWATDRGRRAR